MARGRMSKKAFDRIAEGLREAIAVTRGEDVPFCIHAPIPAARREAAGENGDTDALQAQGTEVHTGRLPTLQAP